MKVPSLSFSPRRIARIGVVGFSLGLVGAAAWLYMTRSTVPVTSVTASERLLQQGSVTSLLQDAGTDIMGQVRSLEAPEQTAGFMGGDIVAQPAVTEIAGIEPTQASDCTPNVTATPIAAASVTLMIEARCDANARVAILQSDLEVVQSLDADGKAEIQLPLLSQNEEIAVLVGDYEPVFLLEEPADFGMYARVALHWQDDVAMELHAFEAEATFDSDGHVSPKRMKSVAHALSNNGGFLVQLGDPMLDDARVAQIYTVPAGHNVSLTIEVPVTSGNCGRDVVAGVIQTIPGVDPVLSDLIFKMPGCDAVGELIFLPGLIAPIDAPEPLVPRLISAAAPSDS